MGLASERTAIESRLQANWSTTPIKYEWAPFQETHAPYIALFIRNGERNQITLGGNPTVRSISLVIVQIFVPAEQGTSLAKTYADSIAAIFDRVQLMTGDSNLISFQTASAEAVGEVDGWAQVNVTIPFSRDEN